MCVQDVRWVMGSLWSESERFLFSFACVWVLCFFLCGQYLFFGSSLWTFGEDEAHPVEFNEEERVYLQGVVGLAVCSSAASIVSPALTHATL
jgi:hypothetical protein